MISLAKPSRFQFWLNDCEGCLRIGLLEIFWSNAVRSYTGQFGVELSPFGDDGYVLWGVDFGLSYDVYLFGRHFFREGRKTYSKVR